MSSLHVVTFPTATWSRLYISVKSTLFIENSLSLLYMLSTEQRGQGYRTLSVALFTWKTRSTFNRMRNNSLLAWTSRYFHRDLWWAEIWLVTLLVTIHCKFFFPSSMCFYNSWHRSYSKLRLSTLCPLLNVIQGDQWPPHLPFCRESSLKSICPASRPCFDLWVNMRVLPSPRTN